MSHAAIIRAMPAIQLTPAQRKEKRADAHHLDPVVMIGGDGLTPAVQGNRRRAERPRPDQGAGVLATTAPPAKRSSPTLADELGAAPIQHIGKLLVLWRPMPPKEKAEREEPRPGPRVVKILKFSKSGNHRAAGQEDHRAGQQRIAAGGELKRATQAHAPASRRRRS